MTILALDTSEVNCSAALLLPSGRILNCSEAIGRGHAERLLPMIEELMAEASTAYADIRRIAVTTGPGTFTGLRIGLSVARGLALSLSVPCLGISGLSVLAAQAEAPPDTSVHALIKGRGGQVYYQEFPQTFPAEVPTIGGEAVNIDAADARTLIVARLQDQPGIMIGSGISEVGTNPAADQKNSAIDVSCLARMVRTLDPAAFPPEPAYLRPADAVKAKPLIKVHNEAS